MNAWTLSLYVPPSANVPQQHVAQAVHDVNDVMSVTRNVIQRVFARNGIEVEIYLDSPGDDPADAGALGPTPSCDICGSQEGHMYVAPWDNGVLRQMCKECYTH